MMNREKIGFLFDLDGVLIDSETEYTRIWQTIDSIYPTGVENFAIKIKGQTLPEILHTYFAPELHTSVTDKLNEMEQQMRYPWLPGARELLERLRKEHYEAVLVTSSNDLKMRHLREERPELEGYFSGIVTADKISHSKPDPEGYLLGASLSGAMPSRCVVFEDSEQGMKAGRAAGAYVVGLTTTLPYERVARNSDKQVADLSEVDINEIIRYLNSR